MKVWIEGRVVEGDEARIPVTDHGLLYGDGVFEGLRVYDGCVFRIDDHLERLGLSARAIGLALPYTPERLREIVLETARAHGEADAYLRLVATRGSGPLGVDPHTCSEPRVFCIADQVALYPREKLEQGLDLITSSQRRPRSDVLDPRVKSLNYLTNVLARGEARDRGADEALLLNDAGHIAEASAANIFCVRDGRLLTPPPTDGALDGITRASVLDVAGSLSIPTAERTLSRVDLLAASEVFLTGTGARLVPVASLDGRELGRGSGPQSVLARLESAFPDYVKQRGTPVGLR